MSYQWPDYSQQYQEWPDYSQQYQGWNPQMNDAFRKPYGTTTKQHYTTSTHTAAKPAKQLHVQDISTASNERIPTTATTSYTSDHSMAQPQQHHKYGPARTHVQQPHTSPYTPNTASTSQTKAPTTTGQQTATRNKSSSTKHTPSATCSTITDIHTNVNTDNTNTHTHTNSSTCGTYTCSRVRQMDSYSECYDSNTNLGGPIYRMNQPTSWSRRRGLHGQDPLQVPFAALARYGAEDYAVRLLSQGKFTGVVATRTAAESVYCQSVAQIIEGLQPRSWHSRGGMPQGTYPPAKRQTRASSFNHGPTFIDEIKTKIPLKPVWNRSTTRRHGSTTSKSTTEASEARHTSDTQRNTTTAPALLHIIRTTRSRKPTNRIASRHTRRRHNNLQQRNQARKSKTESRETRQCRQNGHGAHFESWKHDITGQPSHKSHRHKSDTMARQHEGQKTSHLCEESGCDASYHQQEGQTQFDWNSDSIWSSNGQSPTNELQEFISCSGGGSILCYLTSGLSQFHKLSSFLNVVKKTAFADNLWSCYNSVSITLQKYQELTNSYGHTHNDWYIWLYFFFFGAEDERTQQWIQWFRQLSYTTVIQIQWRTTCHYSIYPKPSRCLEQTHYFVQRPMFYFGSTKVGVCHREYNRHTQLNRYKHGKAFQVELAIRWWASGKQLFTIFDNCSQTLRYIRSSLDIWTCFDRETTSTVEPPIDFQTSYTKCISLFLQTRKKKIGRHWIQTQAVSTDQETYNNIKESYGTIATLRLDTWSVMYKLASYTQQDFDQQTTFAAANTQILWYMDS